MLLEPIWLYLPLAVWISAGAALLVGFRRAGTTLVLRLASLFFALWTVLATTVVVWIAFHGGGRAIAVLVVDPSVIFEFRYLPDWILGSFGAFAVLATAFALNQLAGHGWLSSLELRPLSWPARLPRPGSATVLAGFVGPQREAFSFALLCRDPSATFGVRRVEYILVGDGLRALLTEEELEAVVAHELGHLGALDGRYLTYLRTLARMMRWDPVLALLSASLTAREEREADRIAVQLTLRPWALYRALVKAAASGTGVRRPAPVRSFLGRSWVGASSGTARRLDALARAADRLEAEAE